MKPTVAAICLLICLVGDFRPGISTEPMRLAKDRDPARAGAVSIQIKNVNLLLTRKIVLGIVDLRGHFQKAKPDIPVTLDDSDSFSVDVDSAEIRVTSSSLTALMNEYVFDYRTAPVRNVVVKFRGGHLIQTGILQKGIDFPFQVDASLAVTPDGKIRLHAEKIKAGRLPVRGLLHMLGEDLQKLISENPGRGVRADGDDLILAPESLTPPPHILGHVVRVSVTDATLALFFDSGRHTAVLTPPLRAAAYLYHRGGILRFGKLTMNDADLEIVGDKPGMFNFFQREYKKQLIAGYSKNTAADGLVAHMVDYSHFEMPLLSDSKDSPNR
ncbi:MAG TPA: hypothetical protein VKB79_12845 [Bryobacteraceae bacterium]|nr:hypothetical protein [Bryobacteraceae bacterium]